MQEDVTDSKNVIDPRTLIGKRVMVMTRIPKKLQMVHGNMAYSGVVKAISDNMIILDYGNNKKYEAAWIARMDITSIILVKDKQGLSEEEEFDG